jgi:hypothetical protein
MRAGCADRLRQRARGRNASQSSGAFGGFSVSLGTLDLTSGSTFLSNCSISKRREFCSRKIVLVPYMAKGRNIHSISVTTNNALSAMISHPGADENESDQIQDLLEIVSFTGSVSAHRLKASV